MRKAVVENTTGKIINVIEWDAILSKDWHPPEGCVLMDEGEIDDTWDGGNFVKPELLPYTLPRDLATEITDLKARVEKLEKVK